MKADKSKRPLWLRLLALALAAHLLFGVQRLGTKSLPARLEEISRFREVGAIRYHLGKSPANADILEFLAKNTPEDAVILFAGEDRGVMELAAALLSPRLLYARHAAADDATMVHGRPLARGDHPELGEGTWILVGVDRNELRLELR
jgi:hypothetical protein